MSLVKVGEGADITLPDDVFEALDVKAGDFLRTEIVDGGILLRPAFELSREEAWDQIEQAWADVRRCTELRNLTDNEVMEIAVEAVKEVRREKHEGRT